MKKVIKSKLTNILREVLDYATVISALHIVEEHRFDPIEMKNKRRLRICLDNFVTNAVTKKKDFKMLTGNDLCLSLGQTGQFISMDNKASFYSVYLSESSRRYLCFSWRGLVLCYLVPSFGLTNAPAFNETFMELLHLELYRLKSENLFHNLKLLTVTCTYKDDPISLK